MLKGNRDNKNNAYLSVLSVKQGYTPDENLLSIMESFRLMLNDCIRIGLEQNKTSFMSLRYACYPKLARYNGIASAYKNNAISRAAGILSNYRKLLKKRKIVAKNGKNRYPRIPHCLKPILTTCKGFGLRLERNHLILPSKIQIPLKDYVLRKVEGREMRSVTISAHSVSICYAFNDVSEAVESTGVLGIDLNYENVTTSDTTSDVLRNIHRYPMEKVLEYKQNCRETKRHFKRNDARIMKEIYDKYGKLEADKTQSETHKATSRIIKRARKQKSAVVLEEEVKDIRKLGARGNFQGSDKRFRLNSWARGEAKRQLEYKGKREGVLVFTVNARGTSSKCSKCGNRLIPEENRKMYCPYCNMHIDRDDNAAVNIMKRGLQKLFWKWFRPGGLSGEAVKGNPVKELTTEVIPGVDDGQVAVVLTKR